MVLTMMPEAWKEGDCNSESLMNSFPKNIFASEGIWKKVYVELYEYNKKFIEHYGSDYLSKLNIILGDFLNTRNPKCDQVFALFLIYAFPNVSKKFFEELVFFVVSYRAMMNKCGWQKIKEHDPNFVLPHDDEFCSSQPAEFIPDLSNHYLVAFFPEIITAKDFLINPNSFQLIGLESLKLLRLVLLTKQFCAWLCAMRFTKAKVEIMKE